MSPTAPALALSGSNVTGTAAFSCALWWQDRPWLELPSAGERGDLAVLCQRLCARAGVRPDMLRELRLDLGPGSYVGLRVAVTFARFLQRFVGVPLGTTDSLMAMVAAAAATGRTAQRWVPVLDARRERLHAAVFTVDDRQVRTQKPPAAAPLADLAALLAPGDVVLAAADLHGLLQPSVTAKGGRLEVPAPVDAATLFLPGLPFAAANEDDLEPLYLMGSYAEP